MYPGTKSPETHDQRYGLAYTEAVDTLLFAFAGAWKRILGGEATFSSHNRSLAEKNKRAGGPP